MKRNTHGEFALALVASEFSDSIFSNYNRLSREQFDEVHNMAQKPIRTKENLASCLR